MADPVPKMRRAAVAYPLAGLSGALAILSFPGYNLWPLGFFALIPLLAVIEDATPKRALALGCFAGFVGNAGGFYWLVACIRDYGDLPIIIGIVAYLLLSAANGLGWGVFCWLMRMSRSEEDGRAPWWLAPLAFTAVEFAWWSVFPAYFGAALWKVPVLAQGADLTGIYGLSFLLVLSSAALHEAWRRARAVPNHAGMAMPIFAGVLVLWTVYGAWRMHSIEALAKTSDSIKIGAAQSNIGAFTKRRAGHDFEYAIEELREYQKLSVEMQENDHVDLLMWPETGDPFQIPPGITSTRVRPLGGWPPSTAGFAIQAPGAAVLTTSLSTPAVIGVVTGPVGRSNEDFSHNSAVLVARDGTIVAMSHKIYMVPFGEYLPFGKQFPKLYELIPAISHLQPGDAPVPLVLTDKGRTLRFGSLICYEDILPTYTRRVVKATDADLILNLTNDSWYGDSIEPEIHLALASFRAIEHRRSMVRSTNTGLSAMIAPTGKIVERSGQHVKQKLVGTLPVIKGVTTVYRMFGDWIGWLSLLIVAGVAIPRWRKRRGKPA